MIFKKFWRAIRAQVNKVANFFWTADPIAQMQYEYDKAVEEMKSGRQGLEQYRALVERVTTQVENEKRHVRDLEAKVKAYLQAGDRETAGKFAVELQRVKSELAQNSEQLVMHEKAYDNNVRKIKQATKKLADVQNKIKKYDAELKMSRAEAEMAELSKTFEFDVTTDFGQIESVIQDKISLNRAKARVAADLSSQGMEDIERQERMEFQLAEDALREFEVELGLVTPQTANIEQDIKELGPVAKQTESN
ncbi:MAG TPA: PspA/IM30 family protein [Pirellulaceae bacterium]|nr:PspA/IM30 family protein [Pirellulaceae bacterium]HMO92290.1 PspA/IM30 family protein [Pirellulaceae bacterium]HMP71007.1 PspA/IM30 family protein [Pirellulaceae bacterium]